MNTEPGKKEIYQVVYTSHAVKEFSQEMLAALLEHSRHHNAVHDITGVLMHHDSFFAQCLEGPAAEVTTLLERIAHDERHHHFAVVFEQTSAARAFPQLVHGLHGAFGLGGAQPLYRPMGKARANLPRTQPRLSGVCVATLAVGHAQFRLR